METRNRRHLVLAVAAFLFILLLPVHALAMDYNWIGGSGTWSNPENWGPYGVPGSSSDACYLTQSDSTNRIVTFTPGTGTFVSRLMVDATGTGTMTLEGGRADILFVGINGTGIATGDGFAFISAVLGVNPGSIGIYNLSGGYLSAANLRVGGQGTGIFNQTGGEVSVWDMSLGINSLSTYNLSEGTLNVGQAAIFGEKIDGTFNQSGGIHTVKMGFGGVIPIVVSGGTYNLSGGQLNTQALYIGETTSDNSRFNYSGGELHILSGPLVGHTGSLTNNGTTNLSGSGTRTIDGDVVNNGTFKTMHTTAAYNGTFTNNGAYISDPATQYFNDLVVGQTGYIVGRQGDEFYVQGNFFNNSVMNNQWNTMQAYLAFVVGEDNLHDFYLTGGDFGQTMSAYANNFSWGTLSLTGNSLSLFDGNDVEGGALYLREILGLDISGEFISNITGLNGLNIYYMSQLSGNEYLDGLTYRLTGGGYLMPIHTPEPATMILLGIGLMGLAGMSRRFKK